MTPSRSLRSTGSLSRYDAGLVIVLMSLTGAGCSGCSEPPPDATGGPSSSAPVTSAMPVASSELIHNKLRTTDAKIALGNLDSQISETQRAFPERRDDADLRKKAVSLLLQRAGITGSAKDRARALEIADEFLKGHADRDDAHLIRAQALAAHHRFADALVEIDAAAKLGKLPEQTADLRQNVLAAQGRYDDVYPDYRAKADKYPSPSTLIDVATIAARMGKLDEAEKAFVDAEERFRGATPFILANLYFERGAMFERAGDLAKATILYRAAHERLPQHVHAAVHLAALVSPSEGISILEPLAGGEADPNLLAQLGVLMNLVQAKSGDDALARATARYDALMAEQPLAYADHAGWYWLVSAGEPKKALDAAKLNLSSRKTAEAYELAISAAQAGGSKEELCAFVKEARALPYRSAKLDEIIRPLDCPAAPP